jgi:hypothetical protein
MRRPSLQEDREYSGEVVRARGGYQYTAPRRYGQHSSEVRTGTLGYEAGYHSHGADNPGYDDENFSPQDRKVADDSGKPMYVLTPSGNLMRYDPDASRKGNGVTTKVAKIP